MLLISAHGRKRKADLCKFKARLVYIESSRTTEIIERGPVSKKKKGKKEEGRRKGARKGGGS